MYDILIPPAMHTINPAPNKQAQKIRWRSGRRSLKTIGIGMSTEQKSFIVFIIPAASKCAASLMHCWGAIERVQ